MKLLKPIYKILRSIIICLIMLVVIVYVGLYVLLSVPTVQNKIKDVACQELSPLLGGSLGIQNLSIAPFSEILLYGVSLGSPEGEKVTQIDKVAAGIDLWLLVSERRVVINYAEIIGLDASIIQIEKDGIYNIQFLIDALSPKDKNKPPTRFDLRFRNVLVRDSKAKFIREWMRADNDSLKPFALVSLNNLRLDLSIPALKNDFFKFNIRYMQCDVNPGVELRGLSAEIVLDNAKEKNPGKVLTVRNLSIDLPNSNLSFGDFVYDTDTEQPFDAEMHGFITPADFSSLLPELAHLNSPWDVDVESTADSRDIIVHNFRLDNEATGSFIKLSGEALGISNKDSLDIKISELKANISSGVTSLIAESITSVGKDIRKIFQNAGDISLDLEGRLTNYEKTTIVGNINSEIGNLELEANAFSIMSAKPSLKASLDADLEIGRLANINGIGSSTFSVDIDVSGKDKNAEGVIDLNVGSIEINGQFFNNLALYACKTGNNIHTSINSDDDNVSLEMEADCHFDGINSTVDAYLDLSGLNTAIMGNAGKFSNSTLSLNLDAHTKGSNLDNIVGFLHLSDLRIIKENVEKLTLSNLSLNIDSISEILDSDNKLMARDIRLRSDWMDANITGHVAPKTIAKEIKNMISSVFPSLIAKDDMLLDPSSSYNDFSFDIELKGISDIYDFLDLPVCPLTEIPIKGFINSGSGKFEVAMSTPHIRQGRNKLIRDTSLKLKLDAFMKMAKADATTIYPAKKGDVQLAFDISGVSDKLYVNMQLNPTFESSIKGGVLLETAFSKIPNPLTGKDDLSVHVDIIPSAISMKETVWDIANGHIDYSGKNISVSNFIIEHGNQYVKIDGVASENPKDFLRVRLNDIDLDYIFSILNINYVTFGGMATGEVVGSQLLTKKPAAHTKFLRVKNLSYNGAVLGNGNLASTYFPDQQKVGIYAVINDTLTRERRANIDGGIWVTRDSLSFSFDANKVNLQFMKPFVSAFCSDLKGLGSGKCKLYGSFSDIDLVGNLKADTLGMKIDFTNTWYYAGNDSVEMRNGIIDIKPLTLYDRDGHTAELSGWLRHTYFHEPVFEFRIRDAKSILCYDTNESLNPLWYGTIYGTGDAQIAGRPGTVEINMNMQTEHNSKFFYVISDAEDIGSYSFLSFTDRRKEHRESLAQDTVPRYLQEFIKKSNAAEEGSSNVILSLKGTVTNDAEVTLIMDPIAGDKITACGQGALQMDYNMASNDLRMIGTYILDEGNYYFTLQDIIIKNFIIRPGSKIKFNGDPMDANLDIAATYRVNTNLTDLDKTFSSDKELNRTNVPVDAVLLVNGPMTHPDIDFDIELPTLTSDVERKVKSIVSTNDMMSRQIIYLLALNRFYTPEYTGGSSDGTKEMSSMASSTLSSQLSNILSNMTDKLAVAPSFRSDKGDFTDMEFDLALSSRLLNNRLLINGNFGYRDRDASNQDRETSTRFVGDFDIEYLLNRSGNIRLKAYNHFNDKSYYLKSALTTQGVGVIFRKDFDSLFNFRRRKNINPKDSLSRDSITINK